MSTSQPDGPAAPVTAPLWQPDFRVLFEAAPGLYLVLLPDFTIVAVSDAYLRATMTKREEILGRGLFDVFPDNPNDPEATGVRNLTASLKRVLESQAADTMAVQKYDIRRSDGNGFEERYWSPINSPVLNAAREVAFIIHHVEDVTETVRAQQYGDQQKRRLQEEEFARKAAEDYAKEIWEQRERLRVTLQCIGDGVIATDDQGRITLLNPVAQSLTGWHADEAIGVPLQQVFQIVNEETRHTVVSPALRALHEGVVVGLANHTLLISKDGTERPIADSAAPIRDAAGNTTGVVLVFRDYTERRLAERRLQESEERFRLMVEAVKDYAIFMMDASGTILTWNNGAARIYGYTPDEIIGEQRLKFYTPEDIAGGVPQREMRDTLTVGKSSEEGWRVRKDGSRFWADGTMVALRDEDGYLQGFVKVLADLTERRALEQAFHQSQKMESVGQLAGGIAHDFNNLLTVILGDCEFIKGDTQLSTDSRSLAEEIHQAAEKAAALTRQLLAFSRKQILQPKVLDLNEVIVNSGKMLGRLIGDNIKMSTVLTPRLWPIRIDRGQIDQVLMNLIVNARDAMPKGGAIKITTANVVLDEHNGHDNLGVEPGPYVLVSVSDTGHGMDEKTKAKVFEPFFTTKPVGKGTGLGLATVFGIVKQSEGHISVISEPNQGATFRILLPKFEGRAVESTTPRLPDASARGHETILLVEDEAKVRALTSRTLQSKGYTVIEASNGVEALAAYERHSDPIDLVMTDIMMPVLSGRQLAEQLREQQPALKVLFMSGYSDDASVRNGDFAVETDFIPKPFLPDALAKKVRELLDRP